MPHPHVHISVLDPHRIDGNRAGRRGIERLARPQIETGLLGGRNTIEHHDELITVCAGGDARAAAELSGRHWSELGGHINELFDTNQFAEAAAG